MSEQAKPTAGPWLTERVSDGTRIMLRKIILAKLTHRIEIPRSEHEANARLIAAAPDLLEACFVVKRFLDALELATDESDPLAELRRKVHAPLQAALRTAIAKATGAAE